MSTSCISLSTSQLDLDQDLLRRYEDFQPSSQPTQSAPPIGAFPFEKYAHEELLTAKTPLLYGTDVEAKRAEIRDYFHRTFSLFEHLHDVLLNDDIFYYQPERLRHPLVFYFGHTAVFFLNKLNIAGIIKQRLNPSIESMCAIGVDEMSWDDLNPSHYNWPTIPQLRNYRLQCRNLIDNLIQTLPLQLPINWESPFWIILMGIEHERIHLETSSVLFRQLPPQWVKPTTCLQKFPHMSTPIEYKEQNQEALKVANEQLFAQSASKINNITITQENSYTLPAIPSLDHVHNVYNPNNQGYMTFSQHLLDTANSSHSRQIFTKFVPNRTITLGKSYQHHFYGWDNEYGESTEKVETFEVSTHLVSNQQFLLFMLYGGYYNQKYWSEEGWKFAQYKAVQLKQPWPVFWYPTAPELESLSYPAPTAAISENSNSNPNSSACIPTDGRDSASNGSFEIINADEVSGSDNDDGITTKRFNSTMRVHGLQYPEKLNITGFQYRWLGGLMEMPWSWPCDLNNLESQAYSNFVADILSSTPKALETIPNTIEFQFGDKPLNYVDNGVVCRLPTESEFKTLQAHVLSTYGPLAHPENQDEIQLTTDKLFNPNKYDFPLLSRQLNQNLSLAHASSSPVDYYQFMNSGFYDVVGNVWQHCASVIHPFPHFKVHQIYDDFTVPTYDNMHSIIAGGSWISTGNEACYNARYAFRRHFYQHAGARIGFFKTHPKTGQLQSIEQDTDISNRLHADFYDMLSPQDLVQCESPNTVAFLKSHPVNSQQTARLITETIAKLKKRQDLSTDYTPRNVMVLGCRGGRLAMELAIQHDKASVQGIDTTVRLLGAGLKLMEGEQVSYLLKSSYDQTTFVRLREGVWKDYCTTLGIKNHELKRRVELMQTDVCNLPQDKVPYNHYNCIVVDNLDTAYNPKLLLTNLTRHVAMKPKAQTDNNSNSNNKTQTLIALNIYHQWEQDGCNQIWGYRDASTGEFIDVERGISQIVPNCWKLVHKSDYNQRTRRINERVYTFYDMTTYFYVIDSQ